jgi:hypothetical protein
MATTPNPDDLQALRLEGAPTKEQDRNATYWIEDGGVVFRGYPVKSADPRSFVFFRGGFGKDARACYFGNRRLAEADPAAFRPLNFAYATDGRQVWVLSGRVKDADTRGFEVCDDGRLALEGTLLVPQGYAKDPLNVYHYNFDGKAHIVQFAHAGSFRALGDGWFGQDQEWVFFDGRRIPKARVATWAKLGGIYSRDDQRAYYGNRPMEEADLSSFRAGSSRSHLYYWARDKTHRYCNGDALSSHPSDEQRWLEDALFP